ncbi:MAG: imidazole glycerol phosphate synthase subunit HisH [Nitratireductor sp.]
MRVSIIDYGSGNLHSAQKAFERAARESAIAAEINLTSDPEKLLASDRIVLPGVGAFADCRAGIEAVPGLLEALRECVEVRARPFLGICVGQQLMATTGMEKGSTPGFGWIDGDVVEIPAANAGLKVPQIGWNTLEVINHHPVLDGIPTGPQGWHAYFVHSYHIAVRNPQERIATTDYGGPVTAIVGRDNMVGTQFHPEKSQKLGLALIGNFLNWRP